MLPTWINDRTLVNLVYYLRYSGYVYNTMEALCTLFIEWDFSVPYSFFSYKIKSVLSKWYGRNIYDRNSPDCTPVEVGSEMTRQPWFQVNSQIKFASKAKRTSKLVYSDCWYEHIFFCLNMLKLLYFKQIKLRFRRNMDQFRATRLLGKVILPVTAIFNCFWDPPPYV